jgi:hypothetical protein
MKTPKLDMGNYSYLLFRVTKSLYSIFISSEGNLLSSVNTILGGLQKDTQYRIRETVIDTLGKLGIAYVNISLNPRDLICLRLILRLYSLIT